MMISVDCNICDVLCEQKLMTRDMDTAEFEIPTSTAFAVFKKSDYLI